MAITDDRKREALKKNGTLHPNPEKVRAKLFACNEFFDPRDLVQVKYEMLRYFREENCSVSKIAQMFGLSRPSFYQARERFETDGVAGLFPQTRGPKQAHKLTEYVLEFIREKLEKKNGNVSWAKLSQMVQKRFSKKIHPRSIERIIKKERRGASNAE